MIRVCGNLSVAVLLCHYQRSSEGTNTAPAPRFRNLYVYEPSAVWKKPSMSSEEAFRFAALAAPLTHFGKTLRMSV